MLGYVGTPAREIRLNQSAFADVQAMIFVFHSITGSTPPCNVPLRLALGKGERSSEKNVTDGLYDLAVLCIR